MMEGVAARHLCSQRGLTGWNEARQRIHSHTGASSERGRAGLQARARSTSQRGGLLALEASWTINRDKLNSTRQILEPAFLLEVIPLPSPTLRLVFRSTLIHTQHSYGRHRLRRELMDWKHLLAYITGTVDQALLLRNQYLVTENRMLRNQIKGNIRLSDSERKTLAEIAQPLGKQALAEVATIVKPDTILGWHRKLVAQKCDGSAQRKAPGRPQVDPELEALIVRMAQENRSWGYDRIVGALANLGLTVSDQTVGNVLKRHNIPPAPERKTTTTWKEFIRTHMDVLVATDFFTAEVWTLGGLVTYYVLFFLHLGSRQVQVAGITPHPTEAWMIQVARNVTM